MHPPLSQDLDPENGGFLASAMAKLTRLYTGVPGGPHARLARFQKDMFELCETGHLVPVRLPGYIHYHLAERGSVPVEHQALIMSIDDLREVHREQLRISAARWN